MGLHGSRPGARFRRIGSALSLSARSRLRAKQPAAMGIASAVRRLCAPRRSPTARREPVFAPDAKESLVFKQRPARRSPRAAPARDRSWLRLCCSWRGRGARGAGRAFRCRARVSFHFAPRIPGDKAARAIHARAWRRGASLRPARPCRRGPSRAGFGPFAARGGGWVGWLRRGWFVGVCGGCSFFGGVAGAFGGGAAGGGGAGRAAAGGGRLVVPVLRFFAVPSGGVGVWRGVRLAVLPGRGG